MNQNKLIDGKALSEQLLLQVKEEVDTLKKQSVQPCLSVILVGDDAASHTYVKNKASACTKVGINSKVFQLPSTTSQVELEDLIASLNANSNVHGILVQLPLPKHLDEEQALLKISAEKDVDGFHIINSGKLFRGLECIQPCTAVGILKMLEYIDYDIAGKYVVVIGRSNIVGKPLALMLLQKNATVTVCHSKTQNLESITSTADVLISAVGKPKFITADMIKDGAVLIDVGINRVDGKLCGDFDFDSCISKASKITPVPGGVGKMTIAMLMMNTIVACNLQRK